MKIDVEMDEAEIRSALCAYIKETTDVTIAPNKLNIWVKSQQNYRSEWEMTSIKADYPVSVRVFP